MSQTDNISVQQLYPAVGISKSLAGLYLAESNQALGTHGQPFIYGNYVSSIDGRIAMPDANQNWRTPKHLTTPADWSLFKELQSQADCLLTHGGYLRALAQGLHGNNLQISTDKNSDYLRSWRENAGLSAQPTLLVVSRSANFTIPASINIDNQAVTLITGTAADIHCLEKLEDRGVRIVQTNSTDFITADKVYAELCHLDVRSVYLQTGPELLHSMIALGLLQRLYMTINLSLVGGSEFLTMLSGALPSNSQPLKLRNMYYMQVDSENETEQLFASFDFKRLGDR